MHEVVAEAVVSSHMVGASARTTLACEDAGDASGATFSAELIVDA